MITTTTSTTTTTTIPTYWVVSSITRPVKTSAYTTTGVQVVIELSQGYGTIYSLYGNDFSEESLSSILSRFQIVYLSNQPISKPSSNQNNSNIVTTTGYNVVYSYEADGQHLPLEPNSTSVQLNISKYDKGNYFTNSSSFRKYVLSSRKNKIFTPEKFFGEVFYPQEGKTLYVNFNNLYTAILVEFEINLAAIGDTTTLKFYSDQKVTKGNEPVTKREVGSLLINKYSDNTVLFKPISAYSSYLITRKNSSYYSSTSEMTGIIFNLQNLPKETVLVKFFIFNTVFSNLFTEIFTKNISVSMKPKPTNALLENVQTTTTTTTSTTSTTTSIEGLTTTTTTTTSTTTTTTFFYDTSTYQKQLISVSTSPVHFTVTVYSQ